MKENKVHVAFGFHVNCYHSYRGDSNDNLGFGSDIRIIRKIIETLNKCNEDGIPVKGTWDIENFFSLEQILPQYAPDIIEGIKERVNQYGDENIIMGYSNGALGAMTEEELTASIELAVTNEQGSGLQDVFGEYQKIVRPQEVMFTPSQVSVYNKLNVKALCLYYSCVPFDAFRTIVPKLPDEVAFNPVTYTYKGESMTILPTYNNSDICDAGCLRYWVQELHEKQISGEINNDLFIFVNMDADAIFWETIELPVVKGKIANTDGINGLVREVADLDYVVFNTPGGYLENHNPVGKINFKQDTADGNFTGYASWAEKPYNRKIWTAVERSRIMSKVNAKDDFKAPSFKDRVLLLSTTHFGLATPVLNIEREKTANALALAVVNEERQALKTNKKLSIVNTSNSTLVAVQLKVNADVKSASQIKLKAKGLVDYTIVPMNDKVDSVFAIMRFDEVKKSYSIDVKIEDYVENEVQPKLNLSTDSMEIKLSVHGNVYSVKVGDYELGDSEFLKSFINYDNEIVEFEKAKVKPLELGGNGTGVRVNGEIHLPNEIEGGSFVFDFFTTDFTDAVYVRTDVKYPYTPETTSISTENSSLGRFSDMKWRESVPFQITPKLSLPAVIKRNYMGDISNFATTSFEQCDPKNKKLDSFNHQLSAGFVGLTDGKHGLVVANSRQVLNSMAATPMRIDEDKNVHMNPFGTYYGNQRHHWSRANEEILGTYVLVTPQGKSIAPAYNGNHEIAMLALVGFNGNIPSENVLNDTLAFADGAVALDNENGILTPYDGDNVFFKEAKSDGIQEDKLMNPIFSGISGNIGQYITKGASAIGHIVKQQIKSNRNN